jgi:hypothetical protein
MDKCKKCGKEINAGDNLTFVEHKWRGAGKFQGAYEYAEEYVSDGGIFCSRGCLIQYLEEV